MASVILVEGEDDRQVVRRIMKRTGVEEGVGVDKKDGIDSLIGAIEGVIMRSRMKSVGIVADANDDPDARWARLCEKLQEREGYNFSPPNRPVPGGWVQTDRKMNRRVGIWLMPDNQHPGEIENFVAKMVPSNDPDWQGANRYVQQVNNTLSGRRKVLKSQHHKIEGAALRVWLATGPESHYMGSAITRKDLSVDGPLCKDFCAWLKKLLA